MLVMAEEATEKSLQLSVKDKLGAICPRCFGPGVGPLPPGEPNHIVCLEGNFQHQRHLAASIERGEIISPSLFLGPDKLEAVRVKVSPLVATHHGAQQKLPWHEAEVVSTFCPLFCV
jgi:hypothetical protein